MAKVVPSTGENYLVHVRSTPLQHVHVFFFAFLARDLCSPHVRDQLRAHARNVHVQKLGVESQAGVILCVSKADRPLFQLVRIIIV